MKKSVDIPMDETLNRIDVLTNIGAALSSEQNIDYLLESILLAAKGLLNADGGTIYRVKGTEAHFTMLVNDSINISMGTTAGKEITIPPIQLYDEKGNHNNFMVVAHSILHDKTVNIHDAYAEMGFDFSGTKTFDQEMGYRSKSFLTVPMKNHEDEIIGVLQLINAQDRISGEVIPFSVTDQKFAESLASQAAVALTNRLLIDQLKDLFLSFVKVINSAIDDKSPYTGGHCLRVPTLTLMIAEAAHDTVTGPLKYFTMTDNDRRELELAGLLHDCGKITTPVHVVDKATKLETITDRINLIAVRFEVIKRDAQITFLEACFSLPGEVDAYEAEYAAKSERINSDLTFLRHINIGGEFMKDDDIARVKNIAKNYTWTDAHGNVQDVLNENEIENLIIRAGTLTGDERQVVNHHIDMSIAMLESIPWPKDLKNVTEYAVGHHERMDGKGYPRGLTKDQMSVQARVMGIADIFEALTAKDRPYKKFKTLSESMHILGKMSLTGHIDPDLFDIFVRKQVYLRYANEFLDPEQIDEVRVEDIPGYSHELH
jgi:HD-GYP domain-containing protein (c-di-GMP phosphodiesterase class II)